MTLEEQIKRQLKQPYDPFAAVRNRVKILPLGSKPSEDENVLGFLKSRPQIAALEKAAADRRKPGKKQPVRNLNGDEAADLLHSDRFKDHTAAWQQSETIDDFLKRLPVADPSSAEVGPWLWVRSPQISSDQQQHREKEDVDAFIEDGEQLLHAFNTRKSKYEAENPSKTPAAITRYMRPYREQLEEDLLSAAVKTGTTCGKWMLFPSSPDLPRYWRVVAEAVSQSKLGPVAKVGTYDAYNGKDETLICVYTYNFADLDDVRRVLDELVELDLCAKGGKPIYYKCDAYTYLGIASDNSYKLRASLFSSKEIFGNEARVMQDGPIARLKKRNKTIDSFFST